MSNSERNDIGLRNITNDLHTMRSGAQDISPFKVTSDPTVQITIYDATRTVRGQGEGNLLLQLHPGLYRVHFERAGTVHSEIIDHEGDTALEHPGPPLRSPVP